MTEIGKETDIREVNGIHAHVAGSEFLKESKATKDVDLNDDDTLDENEEVDVNTKKFSLNEERKDGLRLV